MHTQLLPHSFKSVLINGRALDILILRTSKMFDLDFDLSDAIWSVVVDGQVLEIVETSLLLSWVTSSISTSKESNNRKIQFIDRLSEHVTRLKAEWTYVRFLFTHSPQIVMMQILALRHSSQTSQGSVRKLQPSPNLEFVGKCSKHLLVIFVPHFKFITNVFTLHPSWKTNHWQ